MTDSKDESHTEAPFGPTLRATRESVLSLRDGEIHVYQDGPPDAPALLLIHGTAVSARSWEPMVPLLTESHRVIRIDLLGCGRSARPDGASYAVPDQALRAGAALDRLGVEHAIVAGHSSGGAVATALAEQRPDLVTAIALVDTGPEMAAYVAKEGAIRPASSTDPSSAGATLAELTDDQLRQAMADGFRPGYAIPRAYVELFRGVDLEVFAASSRAIRAYLDERSLPERLAPLDRPLLVLFGEQDSRWRPSSAADYRAVPGATIELLPGVGHSPILEDPPLTAAPLLAFTTRHAARARSTGAD